ncbi:hypothetical protein ACJMK2_022149, partial [Sinanodonta woodiana]
MPSLLPQFGLPPRVPFPRLLLPLPQPWRPLPLVALPSQPAQIGFSGPFGLFLGLLLGAGLLARTINVIKDVDDNG